MSIGPGRGQQEHAHFPEQQLGVVDVHELGELLIGAPGQRRPHLLVDAASAGLAHVHGSSEPH
ncbi:hypothetical protein GCM10009616_06220 [Microlunatus lacustris]